MKSTTVANRLLRTEGLRVDLFMVLMSAGYKSIFTASKILL